MKPRDKEQMSELNPSSNTVAQRPVSRLDTEERILVAARKLFIEKGFSGVSGDALCKAARVSKTSLYKYFGDMSGVLIAVVTREGDLFELNVDTKPQTESAFWEELTGYGTRLLNLLNTPFCIQLDRTMHEEARRNPDLAKRFYENAYGRGHDDITALIQHGVDQGFVQSSATASDLADHIISMWEGLRFIRTRLGVSEHPFEDPEAWSKHCVDTLFNR